jgi:curli biogenesis system outer membrane secretion channel CsgG
MKRKALFLVCFALCSSILLEAQLKKRVAIATFHDKSGSGYHSLGEGVADMLATALVKTGKFSVLERQEIEKVIKEQQFGQSFMVTPESAPKVGQILGAELFVVGSVTECGTKESSIGGNVPLFGGGVTTKKARTVVDIRLVNTNTGEIIAAESEEGEESTTGLNVRYDNIDFSNPSHWNETDIGKATREAVNGVVKLITDNMEKIPWSGKILRANPDGTVLMKPGSEGNVKVGMEFEVWRKGEEIKDPDTGLSLGSEESKVGKIKVKDDMLQGKAARATVVEGKDFKVGDLVREKK